MESPPEKPNCLACAHFRVTWDPAFPRACDLFGFKGRDMPSAEVLRAAGKPCPAFSRKERIKERGS
jgi:hypothetical protein